jgi:hypothetical protein
MKNFLWFTGIYVMSVLGIFIVSALIHVLIFLLKA